MEENQEKYADRFKELRQLMGLSLRKMSQLCQYSDSYLSSVEDGKAIPSKEMIETVCKMFHVNQEWMDYGAEPIFIDDEGVQKKEEKVKSVPERLAELRENYAMTYRQFAEKVGSNVETYRNLEQGTRLINHRQAKKIADACNVGIDWLMYGEETAKEYPLNDRMLEYLQKYPEIRKMVLKKIQQIDNKVKEWPEI